MGKSLKGKELGKGITQRPDGLYVARKMVNGKTISLANKSIAVLRKEFKEALDDERNSLTGKMTFQNWYDRWFRTIKAPRMKCDLSADKFKEDYDRTFPRLIGSRKIEDIQQIDIQEAANKMIDNGVGYWSVNLALFTTKQIYKYAIANGLVQTNPCVDVYVNPKNIVKRPSEALDDWVIELFFEAMESSKRAVGEEIFKCMLYTGMRVGEICALKWEDIDFENKCINVKRSLFAHRKQGHYEYRFVPPKSESGIRTIPFIGGIEEVLHEWFVKRQEAHESLMVAVPEEYKEEYHNLLFVTKCGHPYNYNSLRFMIGGNRKRMAKIEEQDSKTEGREPREIPPIRTHLFRHTFATKCFEAGMSPKTVQVLMGHSSYSMTTKYTHITDVYMESEIEKANSVFGGI